MEFQLISKYQYSKKCNDGKQRNFILFFLNNILIFKQKVPFDPSYDKGYDRVTDIYDVYILNGNIHQTRSNKWYCGQKDRPEGKERQVKFPLSKNRLSEFNIPKDLKIEII